MGLGKRELFLFLLPLKIEHLALNIKVIARISHVDQNLQCKTNNEQYSSENPYYQMISIDNEISPKTQTYNQHPSPS